MLEITAIEKAEKYASYVKLLDKENNKRAPSQPQIDFLEKQMARIEDEFQRADLTLDDFLP